MKSYIITIVAGPPRVELYESGNGGGPAEDLVSHQKDF